MNPKRKKILHLITGIELGGGAEKMLLQLLPRLNNTEEHRLCVIRGRGEIGKWLTQKGVHVYYLELKGVLDFHIALRYKKIIKEYQPDIQVNYLIHADIFGRIFGMLFGIKKIIPYIRNIHRNKKLLLFLDRITLPITHHILTNSEAARSFYHKKMNAPLEKISCIPNAIDTKSIQKIEYSKDNLITELHLPEKAFVYGTISRLEKQKDIPTLLHAFTAVRKQKKDTYLIIVGHGKEKKALKKLCKENNITKYVRFLEKRTDVSQLLKLMNVYIHPSLHEGMSNALLEAMCAEKIIITSNIPENTELIQHKHNGYNFNIGNINELVQYMILCKKHFKTETTKKLQKNAYLTIKNKYTLNVITQQYEEFLKNT